MADQGKYVEDSYERDTRYIPTRITADGRDGFEELPCGLHAELRSEEPDDGEADEPTQDVPGARPDEQDVRLVQQCCDYQDVQGVLDPETL